MTTQTSTPISTETTESTATETVTNGTEPATAVAIEAESPLNGAMPKAEPNGAHGSRLGGVERRGAARRSGGRRRPRLLRRLKRSEVAQGE